MPRSIVATNGISTVGAMPTRLTASRQNRVDTRNWPTSLALGVSPSERSWTTFDASSIRPSAPAMSVAPASRNVSCEGPATSTMVIATATSMMTPPMVGVPCLTRWLCGPSARTCCPMWLERSMRIHSGMKAIVSAAAMTMARNTKKVG